MRSMQKRLMRKYLEELKEQECRGNDSIFDKQWVNGPIEPLAHKKFESMGGQIQDDPDGGYWLRAPQMRSYTEQSWQQSVTQATRGWWKTEWYGIVLKGHVFRVNGGDENAVPMAFVGILRKDWNGVVYLNFKESSRERESV